MSVLMLQNVGHAYEYQCRFSPISAIELSEDQVRTVSEYLIVLFWFRTSNVPVIISPIKLCMGSSAGEAISSLQSADLAQPGIPGRQHPILRVKQAQSHSEYAHCVG